MKRLTTKEFKERAIIQHGSDYDYTRSIYTTAKNKLEIGCKVNPAHGFFWQEAFSHLSGCGCNECGREKTKNKQTKSFNEFVKRARKKHGDKYEYYTYINGKTPVEIFCHAHGGYFKQKPIDHYRHGCNICGGTLKSNYQEFLEKATAAHDGKYSYPEFIYESNRQHIVIFCPIEHHGHFSQEISSHLMKHGCSKCFGNCAYTIETFIEEAIKLHKGKYFYDKTVYDENNTTLLEIGCHKHGYFWQVAASHLSGKGCYECGNEIKGKYKKSNTEEFIHKATFLRGDKYLYDNFEYKGSKVRGKIGCIKHGYFEQTPERHLAGDGCPKCSTQISKAETTWLDSLNIPNDDIHRQVKVPFHNGRKYKVDGYDPETNTVYEFLGDYYHGNPLTKGKDPNAMNKKLNKTFGKLYEEIQEKMQTIIDSGYNLVYIWEDEWTAKLKELKLTEI